ncbi:hypothetical protein EDD29_7350 [Actinocorallia herbida]|uniref:DNA-binding protein n=1 Tax=Actinocorallia herbida TaxID=58109 RepID=A0A3N1D803_9ACTN|nr:DNA-binding protein [Actinocorallia herbida]ROO89645.1 hypothetical protein EDD29_7350 [Actinocorallia herbida]
MNEAIEGPSGAGGAAQFLRAGAYLHPDTADPGEGVPVTARAYRRPGLPGRTVVRLVPAETGAAEDAAAAFHGLELSGPAEVVGFGAGRSVAFPEWVLVHHPGDGPRALALLPEIDRLSRLAPTRPRAALDGFTELGARIAASLPHFLPTFFERAAREFLAAGQPGCAARMFTAARKAEDVHGLPIDRNRVDDVFLEFALEGVLPATSLRQYSRELALRLPPDEALARFLRLLSRRTAGGLPPTASVAPSLRGLAQAASGDAGRIEREHLAEMLAQPATALAAESWWKTHRTALKALAGERPGIRRVLLDLTPAALAHLVSPLRSDAVQGVVEFWIGLLEETGAAGLLADDAGAALPEGGALGLLECLLKARGNDHRDASRRLMALETLVIRMKGRLKTELAERGTPLAVPKSADLLDLLLALDLPVADPGTAYRLNLDGWATGADRRDLAALCADPRFAAALRSSIRWPGAKLAGVLCTTPPLRPHLRAYGAWRAMRVAKAGPPTLRGELKELRDLPAGITRIAAAEVRAALPPDLAELLARTLRGGLFAELSWPALDDAVAELFPEGYLGAPTAAEEWPYLVVAYDRRAMVLDGSGVVLDHGLRVPARHLTLGFRYVDGELLVHWEAGDGLVHGYWHTRPDEVLELEGERPNRVYLSGPWRPPRISLETPGGGRMTGTAVIRRGEPRAPGGAELVSDGTAWWARLPSEDGPGWHRLDPRTGRAARPGMPGFFAEPGAAFLGGFLAPFPGFGSTPVGAVVDGLVGQRTVRLPDGTARGEDLAGNATPALAGYDTLWPLRVPGDDLPRALARVGEGDRATYRLIGPDGFVLADTARPGTLNKGFRLPPAHYWVYVRPRDPRGSQALRRAGRELAERLLEGPEETTVERVRAALPEVGDTALIEAVAGVVVAVADLAPDLEETRRSVASVLGPPVPVPAPAPLAERPSSPQDIDVFRAVDGLREDQSGRWFGRPTTETAHLLWKLAGLRAGVYEGHDGAGGVPRVELPVQDLDLVRVPEALAAFTLLAVSGIVPEKIRETLRELLALLDGAGLAAAEPDAWRLFRLRPKGDAGSSNLRRGYQGPDGAFFAVVGQERGDRTAPEEFWAVCHDPSGAFDPPGEFEVLRVLPYAEGTADVPVAAALAVLGARGPAPWRTGPAAEFARLTGVTPTMAGLVVSGLIGLSASTHSALPDEVRKTLGLKVAETAAAQAHLRTLPGKVRRALVGALLPAEPALLWSRGPDVAAAAEVWNRAVPRRTTVPEHLLVEADKVFGSEAGAHGHLRAVLDPAGSPHLSRDLEFTPRGYGFEPAEREGFTAGVLASSVRTLAWLAHRLPAGDRLRALLPEGLAAVRERLAHPGLVLGLPDEIDTADFGKAAGAPDEEGDGWARYGAVLLKTGVSRYRPGILAARLAEDPADLRLPLLRRAPDLPHAAEIAFRTARDECFAALLTDPGDPAEGGRLKDGTWYPQDPSRSAPEVVAEAAERFGISPDAAAVYLMLLAMPDPTDRDTARWTGWTPARLREARTELAATDLVTMARRPKAGRMLFLPCPWPEARAPRIPMETWKHDLHPFSARGTAPLTAVVPTEPAPDLYRRAWRRITEGDLPRFEAEIPRRPPTG